jgi:cell division protein FtsW
MAVPVTPITDAPSAVRAGVIRRSGDRLAVALMVPVALLLIIGLGALMSASSVVALIETGNTDSLFYVKRQLMWIGIGIVAMAIAVKVPYRVYARYAPLILVLGVGGLVATEMIGVVRSGARSWIQVGGFTIQPAEFAKFAVIAFLARAYSRKEKYLQDFRHFLVPTFLALGPVVVLLMKQPDMGTATIVVGGAFAVMFASLTPVRYLAALGGMGLAAGGAFVLAADYRLDRLKEFWNPLSDPLGNGLQGLQSLVALDTGGWFGVGLGASRARWFFLPNAHNDFIFAIIGEEMGVAGALVVLAMLAMMAIVGVLISLRAGDVFARLLSAGIVGWLTIQALINIGGVTVVLPITGVPLPFISSGGSAMVANLFAIGVLVNIARSTGTRPARRQVA